MDTLFSLGLYGAIYIYRYIDGNPPHEPLTPALYRKYRIKPAFPAGPDSVSLQDYPKPNSHFKRKRGYLVQVRREHALSSKTVLIQYYPGLGGGDVGGGGIGNVSYFVFPKIPVGIQDHIWLCAQQVKANPPPRPEMPKGNRISFTSRPPPVS